MKLYQSLAAVVITGCLAVVATTSIGQMENDNNQNTVAPVESHGQSSPAQEAARDSAYGDHAGHGHEAMANGKHDGEKHCCRKVQIQNAVAVLSPISGSDVQGWVMFEQMEGAVRVTAEVWGLEPDSKHGFHIHQYGDMTSDDGSAAGPHYAPQGHDHALGDTVEGHAGDLGNLEADSDGRATFSFTAEGVSIAGGMGHPILGRAVIVHAQPDDGGQPSGNAGDRVAQGVIGVAQ